MSVIRAIARVAVNWLLCCGAAFVLLFLVYPVVFRAIGNRSLTDWVLDNRTSSDAALCIEMAIFILGLGSALAGVALLVEWWRR